MFYLKQQEWSELENRFIGLGIAFKTKAHQLDKANRALQFVTNENKELYSRLCGWGESPEPVVKTVTIFESFPQWVMRMLRTPFHGR